jgi:methionyl-tRNA formyltransferase
MKILFLSPVRQEMQKYLSSFGDEVIRTEEPIESGMKCLEHIDFIISYGYRHILKKDLIEMFPRKIVNLHISLLPWNRGADPNLWSFLEDTPKGVTLHYIECGVDAGDIITQREVDALLNDTLRTSYERLTKEIESLFREEWPNLRCGDIRPIPQPTGGSYHRLRDRLPYQHLLTKGWDTPVHVLIGKALKRSKVS